MFHAVDPESDRGVELVRGDRPSDRMRVVDDALLEPVWQPHVGFEEVDAERSSALELAIDLFVARHRHAARVVDAHPVEWIARDEHPRAGSPPRIERLPLLDALVRIHGWNAQRRDSVRQPHFAEIRTVVWIEMRVHFDQSWNHRLLCRVDNRAHVQIAAMARNLADDAALDDDVRFALHAVYLAVEEMAGVDDNAIGRVRFFPLQREWNRLGDSAKRGDAPQAGRRLIHDVPGVALPAWRFRLIGRDGARRPRRTAAFVDRHGPQRALADERHAEAIRRPGRAVVLAISGGMFRKER